MILAMMPLVASMWVHAAGQPVALSPGPHLFVDNFLIEDQSELARIVCPPQRLPEPIVTGPEDKCFQPYLSVVRDPDTKRFRLWYGVPENAGQSHVAYMESDDGIHWERPHRVLDDPSPIQFGVSIIDEGPDHPDRAKRYKYGYWHGGGLRIAVSPDGLTWTPLVDRVVLEHNHDITAIFRDPLRERYGALPSRYIEGETWAGNRRIPHMSVSDDLVHWRPPWPIIAPDERDEGETQFYCMDGVLARGGLLIGLLKVLRDDLVVEGAPEGAYGLGYTVLAWSRDGAHWERDRDPFMDHNPRAGAWDHAMTWGDDQLIVGDETYVYYGGYRWGHKWERFTQRQIGLARMKRDRCVARRAREAQGVLRTTPFVFDKTNHRLVVNAQVHGGLRVRVLDVAGAALPGFDWEDCERIRGDSLEHAVRWTAPQSKLCGRPIRLEFALCLGDVYGFAFAPWSGNTRRPQHHGSKTVAGGEDCQCD